MTKPSNDRDAVTPSENIFHIVDGMVRSVDRTKKLVLIMLAAIVISVPVSFHLTSVLVGPPYHYGPARIIIPGVVVIAFLVIGVRQWIVLSKWTNRYNAYKEMQKRIDKDFDFESENDKP